MSKKFLICLLVMLFIMVGQGLAERIYVENPSFEEPDLDNLKTHGWDEEDGAYLVDTDGNTYGSVEVPGWESDGTVEDSGLSYLGDKIFYLEDGDQYGFIMGDDPTVYQLTDHTIAAGEYFTMTFDAYNEYDGPEMKGILYYLDGMTRVPLASDTVTGLKEKAGYAEYGKVVFTAYDHPDSIGKKLGIEFDNPLNDDDFTFGTWSAMDNVKLDVSLSYANDIKPLDGAENVLLDATLEWYIEEGYTFNVYFGDDPNWSVDDRIFEDSVETTYDPGGLEYDTTYYWQVDTIDPNESGNPVILPGLTWSFTTITEYVVITTEPQSTTVEAGTTAKFSVEAMSVTPIQYQWYKVNEGGDDILLEGQVSEVLTIEGVQLADEGYYYCSTTNDTEVPTVSAQARLMVERLVGWWKLDGNLNDSVQEEFPGVETHDGEIVGPDLDYVTDGVDGGSAIDFVGDGRVINILNSEEYFNFYPQGMTLSLWIRAGAGRQDGIMNKQMIPEDPYSDSVGWLIGIDSSIGAEFTLHPEDTLSGTDDYGDIFDGDWHLVTAVTDPNTQTYRIYVDGIVRSESDALDLGALPINTEPVVIGAESAACEDPYIGQLDDVRIWNYPREELDIAWMYLDFKPDDDVCLYQDEDWLKFDYAGEPGEPSYCRIDIEDVVEFASTWLECHLVPTCVEL